MTIGEAIFYIFLILYGSALVGGIWYGLYKVASLALGAL